MKQVITLPTGDFTCSLSSGCGAVCSATSLPSGLTSASTPASANSTGSASGATPASPAPDASLPGYGLVGPLYHNMYSWRSTKAGSRYEWGPAQGWYETCQPNYGHSQRDTALANPPTVPPPDYTPPAPSKPESVDAAYVAANAGLYINDEGETFRSDGSGIVTVTLCDGQQKQWIGVEAHEREPATRFRPLPPATPASKAEFPDVGGGVPMPDYLRRELTAEEKARAAELRTPAPSPVEGERVDYGSIGEQARAWEAVCDTAHEVFPGWHHLTNRGIDSMCVLLRNNASSLAAARAEVGRARARAQSVAEDIQEATLILNRAVVDAEGLASSPTVEKGAGK